MHGSSIKYVPRVNWLVDEGSNVYTQFGEDGLIDATLKTIGTTCRHCFEVGAADGRFFSNTLRLRQLDWYAVLMEQDAKLFDKLKSEFGRESACLPGMVTNLDDTLAYTTISDSPDLGVIDIDGQDYWLWHDMERVRPRVMLVEIKPDAPDEPIPERGGFGQAGLNAIETLGQTKGYELAATTHCNALFVRIDCMP